MSSVVLNTMSIDEHVKKINEARFKVQSGIFEMASSITDAVRQLDGKQTELAQRLGMPKGTISKWISIGSNSIIMNKKKDAPSSFNALYQLSSLDNKYCKYYGEKKGKEKFSNLFINRVITPFSNRNDISKLIKTHKYIIGKHTTLETKKIEQDYFEKNHSIFKSEIKLDLLIKSNLSFNTIIVIPTLEQISRWKNFEDNELINKDYPIKSLENLDENIFQQCLIKVKIKDLVLGVNCLHSWGFVYNDMLVPNQSKKGLVSIPLEYVLLKGGKGESIEVNSFVESIYTIDILSYAQQIGVKPFLLAGEVTTLKEWVYCVG